MPCRTKRKKKNLLQKHLSEKVMFGGILVTRGKMVAELQRIAKIQFPKDTLRQTRVVNIYLAGKGRR